MFGRKLTPLKYSEVVRGLKTLRFEMKSKGSTGHEQWFRNEPLPYRLVTVDKHTAPFARDLIKLMANQAGLDARKFHALCRGIATASDVGFEPAE